MNSGIYTITNIINNKIYLGKAKNIEQRKKDHFDDLIRNNHYNVHLQAAFNKYGSENFIFEPLLYCSEEFLYSEEHYWAILLNVNNINYGYNIRDTNPNGNKGSLSIETKLKISKAFMKPIIALTKDGVYIGRYESTNHLNQQLKCPKDKVSLVISGKAKYYKNYTFVLEKDYDNTIDYSVTNNKKRKGRIIEMYDLENNLVKQFISLSEAALFLDIEIYVVWRMLNNKMSKKFKENYILKYKEEI